MIIIKSKNILVHAIGYTLFFGIITLQAIPIYQADIDAGLVITQQGTWELAQSVTFVVPCAISILADNVTLNLQNYTMDGQAIGECAISVTGNNCLILNGLIQATTQTAIQINDSTGSVVEQMTIQNAQDGISVTNSGYTNINNITVHDNEGYAIAVYGESDGTTIGQALIYHCTTYGIIVASNTASLTGITIYGITGDGVQLIGDNIQCYFVSSSLNTGNGFLIAGQTNTLQLCYASQNGIDGMQLATTSSGVSIIGGISSGNANIGIDNLGATSNTASFVDVRKNKVRDLWRIVNGRS